MTKIDSDVLEQLRLPEIDSVTLYKRDELTTDLICCDVAMAGAVRTFHEELAGWDVLLQHLYKLPNFRTDWYGLVSQSPFQASKLVAFSRQ